MNSLSKGINLQCQNKHNFQVKVCDSIIPLSSLYQPDWRHETESINLERCCNKLSQGVRCNYYVALGRNFQAKVWGGCVRGNYSWTNFPLKSIYDLSPLHRLHQQEGQSLRSNPFFSYKSSCV